MLINCHKCGKPISDKAKTCVHCGAVVGEQSESRQKVEQTTSREKKNYYGLDSLKRKELLLRFGVDDPLQYKAIRSSRLCLILQVIFGGIAILLSIVGIIVLITVGKDRLDVVSPQFSDFLTAFGTLAVALLFWIVFAVLCIISKSARQKEIIAFKSFEKWLNKRNIEGFAEKEMDNAVERQKLEELDI